MLNVHPLLVHFPIALLTVYALMELLRIKRLQAHPHVFALKAFLVIVGALSLVVTYQSGELIEEQYAIGELNLTVERHATFALASHVAFGILGLGYVVRVLREAYAQKPIWNTFLGASLQRFSNVVSGSCVAPCLAFLGLVSLTITGALGGAIVHGPEIDPMVNLIYHLFVR